MGLTPSPPSLHFPSISTSLALILVPSFGSVSLPWLSLLSFLWFPPSYVSTCSPFWLPSYFLLFVFSFFLNTTSTTSFFLLNCLLRPPVVCSNNYHSLFSSFYFLFSPFLLPLLLGSAAFTLPSSLFHDIFALSLFPPALFSLYPGIWLLPPSLGYPPSPNLPFLIF